MGQNLHNHSSVGVDLKLRHPEKGLAVGSAGFNNPSYFSTLLPQDWATILAVPDDEFKKALEIDGTPAKTIRPHSDALLMIIYMPFAPLDGLVITAVIVCLSPTSRGTVALSSPDVQKMPDVDPNCNATEHDKTIFRSTLRTLFKAMESPAGQEFILGEVPPNGELALTS